MSKLIKILGSFVAIGVLGWVSWGYLAIEPLSKDLSVIGQGKPTVVLVYESYMTAGMEAMERIKQVRPEFESSVNFRVAHISTPEGDRFAQLFNAGDGAMVLFDGTGEAERVLPVPRDLEQLKREVAQLL